MRAPPPAPTAAPQGGSPTFPPKHSVQRERETIAPAYLISAARRRAAAPRGAPKSHFKCGHHFSLAQISISQQCAWARARAPPARCSPSPDARLQGGRARGAAAGSPSPWGGGALYPVAVLARLRSAPPPTRWLGLPASRGLPQPPRESGRRGRISPPPCVFYRPQGGRFARGVRVVFAWWFFAPFPRAAGRRCGAPSRSGRRNAPPAPCAVQLSRFSAVFSYLFLNLLNSQMLKLPRFLNYLC